MLVCMNLTFDEPRETLVSCAWVVAENGRIRHAICESVFTWQSGPASVELEAAFDLNGDGILEAVINRDDGSSSWLDIVEFRSGAMRFRELHFCYRTYT